MRNASIKAAFGAATIAFLSGCAYGGPPITSANAQGSQSNRAISAASVSQVMDRVAEWQFAQFNRETKMFNADASADGHPQGWVPAVLYVGLVAHARATGDEKDWARLLDHANLHEWRLAPRTYNADDYAIGQLYLDLAEHYRKPEYALTIRSRLDYILANPSKVDLKFIKDDNVDDDMDGRPLPLIECRDRWCWCDALFMAPPVWMQFTEMFKDPRYAQFADKEWWAATKYLYDPEEKLYFRDSRFFDQRTPSGKEVFWGRGNGWTSAGLARTIDQLPAGIDRAPYEELFRDHAGRLAELQNNDGYWNSSLLDRETVENPETSGTALIVYALAWGVNNGLLDRAKTEPVIDRGWRALVRAVHPDGKLGYVQQVAAAPGKARYEETQAYGVGGFLMAGEQVMKLKAR